MKYYKIDGPVKDGTYPVNKNYRNSVDFGGTKFVPEIGRDAYGYCVYRNELKGELAEAYGLVKTVSRIWYKVRTRYCDNGRVICTLDGTLLQAEKPDFEYHSEKDADVYIDFVTTAKQAQRLINEIRAENSQDLLALG